MNGSAFLVDTNVWLAATFANHPFHPTARAALARRSPNQPALFCRSTQQSFLRLITTPVVLREYSTTGITNRDAWLTLARWMEQPQIAYREEPAGLIEHWRALTQRDSASPKLWMDAYLAAFAIAGTYRLLTLDKGFKQFKGLAVELIG